MADPSEQAKRRRECWQTILSGLGMVTSGFTKIVAALALYYVGESLTTR